MYDGALKYSVELSLLVFCEHEHKLSHSIVYPTCEVLHNLGTEACRGEVGLL